MNQEMSQPEQISYCNSLDKVEDVAERFRDTFNQLYNNSIKEPGNPICDVGYELGPFDDQAKALRYLSKAINNFYDRFQHENSPIVAACSIEKNEDPRVSVHFTNPHNRVQYAEFSWKASEIQCLGDLHVRITDIGAEEVREQFEAKRWSEKPLTQNEIQTELIGILSSMNNPVYAESVVEQARDLAEESGNQKLEEYLERALVKYQFGDIPLENLVRATANALENSQELSLPESIQNLEKSMRSGRLEIEPSHVEQEIENIICCAKEEQLNGFVENVEAALSEYREGNLSLKDAVRDILIESREISEQKEQEQTKQNEQNQQKNQTKKKGLER